MNLFLENDQEVIVKVEFEVFFIWNQEIEFVQLLKTIKRMQQLGMTDVSAFI